MCDDLNDFGDFDDFGFDSFSVADLTTNNEEFSKRIKERKLVEESDLEIAKRLFSNHEEDTIIENKNEKKQIIQIKPKTKRFNSNELKQKETIDIIRKKKENKISHVELYDEYDEYDEYKYYDNKFNKFNKFNN